MVKKAKNELPAHGDNSDKLQISYVEEWHTLTLQEIKLRGKKKDLLNKAKNDGFLKTSIKQGYKKLTLNEEQLQARAEVEAQAEKIFELCCDLPLFQVREAA